MKPSFRTSKARPVGFTLIELLVVIAIIAILAGLLFPIFAAIREHGRRVKAAGDERLIVSAISAYYTEYQKYPIDTAQKTGDAVYSTDNNALFDVLRNATGNKVGNPLNPKGVFFLSVPNVADPSHPMDGIQASTGVWYDPWGSPYNVALDGNYDGQLNSPSPLPNFYSDVGALQPGVLVWSFGKNGLPGGGPATGSSFGNESGTPGKLTGSGDIKSW